MQSRPAMQSGRPFLGAFNSRTHSNFFLVSIYFKVKLAALIALLCPCEGLISPTLVAARATVSERISAFAGRGFFSR